MVFEYSQTNHENSETDSAGFTEYEDQILSTEAEGTVEELVLIVESADQPNMPNQKTVENGYKDQ